MSWALTNLNSVVDVGFVLLVSAVCVRSLTGSSSEAERIAARWREELRELERALRELITEAGSASSSLDRRLLRRKTELETLLKKIEDNQQMPVGTPALNKASIAQKARAEAPRNETQWELGSSPEFPNESWVESAAEVEEEYEIEETEAEFDSDLGSLAELVESASDTIELSTKIEKSTMVTRQAKPAARAAAPAKVTPSATAASALAAQIEKVQADQQEQEERVAQETFKRLSIMDPTAYRIARRLLADGTEIHVVARKLDLPVSEIRLLDKLMREETAQRARELEVGPNYKPTEIVPAKKIVRSTARKKPTGLRSSLDIQKEVTSASPATRTAAPARTIEQSLEESIEIDVEGEIERELALL